MLLKGLSYRQDGLGAMDLVYLRSVESRWVSGPTMSDRHEWAQRPQVYRSFAYDPIFMSYRRSGNKRELFLEKGDL
jgi:hypothetical protein